MPRILYILLVMGTLALSACGEDDKDTSTPEDTGTPTDDDGDGYPLHEDCDDGDAAVHPNADELCDGVDNNCDGEVDEGLTGTLYEDNDGDGFGDITTGREECLDAGGMVEDATDCDDSDASINPAAEEICNGLDENCNGQSDEGLEFVTWFLDYDGDGYGDPEEDDEFCEVPMGYVDNDDDCDDTNADINPTATEICNELDDDCNQLVDDGLILGTFFLDADGDGYGTSEQWEAACEAPVGYVGNDGDCDDSRPQVHPDADEYCDGIDNDCNGATDDGTPVDAPTWYADADGDGYGHPLDSIVSCTQPSGYITDNTDCDDTDAVVNPSAMEVCDPEDLDQDCDGLADDADPNTSPVSKTYWYVDADGDGYGDESDSGTKQCDPPSGYVEDNTDCDDAHSVNNPGAEEFCDGVDNDCDGNVDGATAVDGDTWYDDDDGDGYGDPDDTRNACSQPSGYVADDSDCDDHDASVTDECWDTAEEVGYWDDTYTGTIVVDASLTAFGISDTCSGSMTIYVTEANTPQVRGAGTCTFAGTLSSLGEQEGIVDGNITTDPWMEGSISVGSSISDTWRGKFIDDYTLEGSFSGTTTISGFSVDYTGDISVSR